MDTARENMNEEIRISFYKEMSPEKIEEARRLIKRMAGKLYLGRLKINPQKEYGGEV